MNIIFIFGLGVFLPLISSEALQKKHQLRSPSPNYRELEEIYDESSDSVPYYGQPLLTDTMNSMNGLIALRLRLRKLEREVAAEQRLAEIIENTPIVFDRRLRSGSSHQNRISVKMPSKYLINRKSSQVTTEIPNLGLLRLY